MKCGETAAPNWSKQHTVAEERTEGIEYGGSEENWQALSKEGRRTVYDDHRIGGCSTHLPQAAEHRESRSKIGQNGFGGFCVFGSCVRIRSHRTGIRSLELYIQWAATLTVLIVMPVWDSSSHDRWI